MKTNSHDFVNQKHMIHGMKMLFIVMMIMLSAQLIQAQSVWEYSDDFDGSALDSQWDIFFNHADGWTYEVTNSRLRVTAIDSLTEQSNVAWSEVRIRKELPTTIPSMGTFHCGSAIHWNNGGMGSALQEIMMVIKGEHDTKIASVGYSDPWNPENGTKLVTVGTDVRIRPGGHLANGNAYVEIEREADGLMTILWNNEAIWSGIVIGNVKYIEFSFTFYPHGGYVFGTEEVGSFDIQYFGPSVVPNEDVSWSSLKNTYR